MHGLMLPVVMSVMAHDLGLAVLFCHDVRASKEGKVTNLVNSDTTRN